MPKVALIQVVYNNQRFMPVVMPAIFNQTYKDFEFYAVVAGNDDKGKEYLQENFPQVKIIDPGYNIGFSKGHNELFESLDVDLFQLINPDLVLSPTYLEEIVKTFDDPKAGAATGKILQYDFEHSKPTNLIDTTGVTIDVSGRARDRGQHEVDSNQYDTKIDIAAVSGAAAMYRKAALKDVKYTYPNSSRYEYFDEEFFMYWEDVDLSWRILNSGWGIKYNPQALAYHGRTAASSKGGYARVLSFIKHHKKISSNILKWNYKNHIFMFLKNSPKFYLKFFIREFFYQVLR